MYITINAHQLVVSFDELFMKIFLSKPRKHLVDHILS